MDGNTQNSIVNQKQDKGEETALLWIWQTTAAVTYRVFRETLKTVIFEGTTVAKKDNRAGFLLSESAYDCNLTLL